MPLRLPGLLNSSLSESARLSPTAGSLTLKMYGSSEATLTLPEQEAEEKGVRIRDWISIYTEEGLAGIFRVTNVSQPLKKQVDLTLLHGIDILSDSVWGEQTDFEGTKQEFLTSLLNQQTQLVNGVKPWVLGVCEDTATVKRSINYDRLNTLLEGLIEEGSDFYFTYDQSVFPWRLNYVRIDNQVMSEFRMAKNIRSATITYNDADLCTRLFLTVSSETEEVVPTKKLNPAWVSDTATPSVPRIITENVTVSSVDSRIKMYENTAAQARWGIVVKTADIDTQDDIVNGRFESADAWAASFLARRSAPSVQIQVDGDDLSALTGEPWDRARLARLCQVALPAYGETFRERVLTITWPELFKRPTHITLSLANTLPRFTESLAAAQTEAASASRSSRATARAQTKEEKEITTWSQHVQWQGAALDGSGIMTLYETGIDLDATGGARIYSLENGLQGLYGELVVQSQRIDAKVGSDALNGYLQITALSTEMGNVLQTDDGTIGAKIATAVNAQTGDSIVTIDASKVNITGLVTMTQLEAVEGKIDTVRSETITADTYLSAATGKFNTLWVESPGANGSTNTAQVNNAINSITPYTPSDPGKIGFKYTTLANPVGQPVDFSIADTEYYRDHVGIEATGLTVTEIGQTPYNNHSAEAITTPEIKAGTSDKYYLISATAKDGTTTVYKKFTLPAASAPPVTASIDDITGTSIAANHIKDTSIPLTASGTNVAAYTENLTLEETTYQVGSITRPCVVLKLDGSVIGRIYTGNSYNRGWDAAAGVVVLPAASATPGGTMAVSVPYVKTVSGTTTRGTDQITYTLRSTQNDAYISIYNGDTLVGNYAHITHNQYTLGQDSVSASLPTGTPPAGTNASELSPGTYALTLTKGSTPSVLGYYTVPAAAVVTPKVSKGEWSGGSIKFTAGTSGEDEATVALKMSVDTGTNKSTVIKVLDGQTETGNSMTVYLKADNDKCYITSTDYTPNANNILAQITNPKTATAASIDSIVLRKADGHEYVYVDEDREFAVYVQATGTNVSAKDETLYIDAGDAVDHGKRLVSAVLAETASSAAAPSTLVSGKTYNLYRVVDGTRESAAVSSYTVTAAAAPVSASIDDLSGVAIDENALKSTIAITASGTNVASRSENVKLAKTTYPVGATPTNCVTLTMDGVVIGRISTQSVYIDGRDSVTITSVERVASCAFDHDAQTAKQDVKVTLDNGQSYTIHEDFSDVYRAGRAGTSADTTIEYAVDLASEGVYFDTVDEGLTIDLSDIYQAGRNYTPPVLNWYTYSPTGGDVPIYVRGGGSGSSDDVIGSIYEHLNQFHVSTSIAFYACTPVEVVGSLLGYTQVSYGGKTYYVDPSNLVQSETDLSIGHRIGIKDLTAYAVSTTMTGLIHTGGATSGISVYLEPYNGTAKNYTSSYVPSSDFSSYRANGNASSYFYEMAAKSGYYGRHEKTAYSGDIQHKAIFEILYSDGNTETVVVSFNSYAKAADEVVYTYPGYIDANNYVNLRSTNSTAGTVLAQVPDRSTVMCQYNPNGYTGTWMPVQYGGKTGYIQSKFIEGTKDWNDLNTKTISTITLVGVAHAMGSSKKDITVTLHPQKNGMKFTTSYATESNEYTYDWAVTNTDTDTYLLHPASGCYMYHSKSAYSSTMRMRVKLNVTYTNSSKFPPETVVLQVDSVAK